MKSAKAKRILLSAASMMLVATLSVAGTVAYLQDSSDDVVNTFSTNNVNVKLEETTGDDYNIIPGTSETKDPKVTVDNSVDAYVYIVVTDNTDGLVTYEIDEDIWTPLTVGEDENTVTVNDVYYREVGANETTKEFYVLEGNKVSYSPDLTNDDMPENSVSLTFTAYAIQKINGDSAEEGNGYSYFTPAEAYYQARFGSSKVTVVENVDALTAAIAEGEVAVLDEDISASFTNVMGDRNENNVPTSNITKDITIDLNNHTLTNTDTLSMVISGENTLTITDGELVAKKGNTSTSSVFGIETGATLNLENVDVVSDACIAYPRGDAAEVNIVNCNLTAGVYCVATNAESADNYGVVINIVNSVLKAENSDYDNAPVLINVAGTLNIDNSNIIGQRQGVIVRAGTAKITNSTITLDAHYGEGTYGTYNQYYNSDWSSGNEVPAAALVVGNHKGTYNADAICDVSNTTIMVDETDSENAGYAIVYVDGNGNYSATLTLTNCGLTENDITVHEDAAAYFTVKIN